MCLKSFGALKLTLIQMGKLKQMEIFFEYCSGGKYKNIPIKKIPNIACR